MRSLNWIISGSLLIGACATVEAPKGGPEDKLPPRVAGVSPAPQAVQQPTDLNVTLLFDEWIADKIPRNAVSVSPPIEKKLQLEVDGDRLYIRSKSPLDSNTTYTLTITSGLKDLRGNAIGEPFHLVFSTGPILDSLGVQGRVLMPDSLVRKKSYPAVGLFPFGNQRAGRHYLKRFRDSLLTPETDTVPVLHREPPLYLTHTDSLGFFKVQGMQPGVYQVVAFTDLNGNQRLEPQMELAGLAEGLLKLDSVAPPLWITLGDQDTSALMVEGASQRGNRLLELAFSRKPLLDSAFTDSANCGVRLKNAKDDLRLPRAHFQEPLSGNWVMVMDSLKPDSVYVVQCAYAVDSLGRALDRRLSSTEILWTKMSDQVGTRVSKTTPSRGQRTIWPDEPVVVAYNAPIGLDSMSNRFRVVINQDTLVPQVRALDAVRLELRTETPWPTDATIRALYLQPDTSVTRPDSNGRSDTLVTWQSETLTQFETVSKLKLASFEGVVPGGNAATVIRLRSRERPTEWLQAPCDSQGRFRFNNLLEGFYSIDYFHDFDGNGVPSPGRLFPPTPGEPWRAPQTDLILPHGDGNILEKLVPDLPRLPSSVEIP